MNLGNNRNLSTIDYSAGKGIGTRGDRLSSHILDELYGLAIKSDKIVLKILLAKQNFLTLMKIFEKLIKSYMIIQRTQLT